ncbi:hypothetical protein CMK11_08135, partial [Candidatus Poribacteria bacterium]|nr:hypothetical protein [Candidatus Poribacteria bacterium]
MYGSCGSSSHRLWQHMRVWAAAAAAALLLLLGAAASAVAQVDARPAIGGTIAYVQRVGLAYEIHVQDLPGGSSRRVWRQEDGFIEALSLSRDATKIAFQASDFVGFWEYDIYVLRIGEDEARQVTELAALARATAPAWSPDGSRLAYGVEMQRQFPEASLFLAGPMGMGVAPFVDARALAYEHPSWSLDGRSIAFRKVDAERTSTIWRAD